MPVNRSMPIGRESGPSPVLHSTPLMVDVLRPNHAPAPAAGKPPLKLEVVGSDSGLREQHQIRLQIVLRDDGCNR